MKRGGAKKRRDASETAIIQALQAVGAFVRQCHGDGAPDLIVRFQGVWKPLEVKSEKGRIRKKQAEAEYPIVHTPAEALEVFGMPRHKPC